MTNLMIGMIVVIGSVSVATSDVPDQFKRILSESVGAAQQVSTAGDLHSMSVMLDAGYVMDHRLPEEDEFVTWLNSAFKENNIKDLSEDHWGNAYVYKVLVSNRSYKLTSMGADGILGTSDDMITSGP